MQELKIDIDRKNLRDAAIQIERISVAIDAAANKDQKLSKEERTEVVALVESMIRTRHTIAEGDSIEKDINRLLEPHQFASMGVARSLARHDGPDLDNPFNHEQLRKAYQSEKAFIASNPYKHGRELGVPDLTKNMDAMAAPQAENKARGLSR